MSNQHARDDSGIPRSAGRPATAAFRLAGLTSLEHFCGRSEAELLALHGVGPKAVRVIKDALAERGLMLRQDNVRKGRARGGVS